MVAQPTIAAEQAGRRCLTRALAALPGQPAARTSQDWPPTAAARPLGVELRIQSVHGSEDLLGTLETVVREHAEAVHVPASGMATENASRIVDFALQYHLPTMFAWRAPVDAGGLIAYGSSLDELARRAAYYVDRILQGAKPADLPVEQPGEFDFVINVKTAQALGLTIPQHVLLQATELIQ